MNVLLLSLLLSGATVSQVPEAAASGRVPTLKRLEMPLLERLHKERADYALQRRAVVTGSGYLDLRCVLHAHSYLSHDSRGTIAEIAEAAKKVGVDALFLTNHPQEKLDVVAAGQKDPVNGVLFVSGSETNGFLAFPGDGKLPDRNVPEQAFVDAIRHSGGLIFVAHPEEHKDWSLKGLTGTEIYNTHADVMDEKDLLAALRPKDAAGYARLLQIMEAMNRYPQEAFAALFDPPTENLAHYDRLSTDHAYAAVAGNDSHQNTGFILKGLADKKIAVEDPLGERITVLDAAKNPVLATLFGEPVEGKEMLRRIFDPYPASFGYVSTHVLAKERTVQSIKQALVEGRSYVAFDWIADPTGMRFEAGLGTKKWIIGDAVTYHDLLSLTAVLPLRATIRILKDGVEVARGTGRTLRVFAKEPGVYRMEASLLIGGELRPWIYTGAIRVVPK